MRHHPAAPKRVVGSISDTGLAAQMTSMSMLHRLHPATVLVPVIVKRPYLSFSACSLVLFVVGAIAGSQMELSPDSNYDWNISEEKASQRRDAVENARSQLDPVSASATPEARNEMWSPFTYVFNWRDGRAQSIFTPANVKIMCELENIVLEAPRYSDFCLLRSGTEDCDTTLPLRCALAAAAAAATFVIHARATVPLSAASSRGSTPSTSA